VIDISKSLTIRYDASAKRFPATPETRARSSAALQYGNLMAHAIDSNSSAVRVRGSLRATGTAPLVRFAMNAGYRPAIETTNEFVWIKF
jgi:hypothetical protein